MSSIRAINVRMSPFPFTLAGELTVFVHGVRNNESLCK